MFDVCRVPSSPSLHTGSWSIHRSVPKDVLQNCNIILIVGDVRILDIGNQVDPLLVQSGLGDQGHKEPITEVTSLRSSKARIIKLRLITLARVGGGYST